MELVPVTDTVLSAWVLAAVPLIELLPVAETALTA
jgi:hypothetical protein